MTVLDKLNRLNLNEERFTKPILLGLLLVSVVFAARFTYPALRDRYVINNDLRITIYWMAKFNDPELFNDYISKRIIQNSYGLGPGYIFLYRIASLIMEPLLFSKILPFIVGPLTILFVFKIGKSISGNVGGLISSLLVIPFLQYNTFGGGLHRAFLWPLFSAFVYYLITSKFLGVAIVLILQSLFYALTLPISVLVYFLSSLYFPKRKGKIGFGISFDKQKSLLVLGAILISFLVLSPAISRQAALRTGRLDMATFSDGGALPTISDKWVYYGSLMGGAIEKIGKLELSRQFWFGNGGIVGAKKMDGDKITPLLLLSFLFILILRKESFKLDRVVYSLPLSSIILYTIAWIFLPALYFPGKYNVGLMLFLIIFTVRGFERLISTLPFQNAKRIVTAGMFFLILSSFYPSFLFSREVFLGTIAASLLFLTLPFLFRKLPTGLAYYNVSLAILVVLIGIWLTIFKPLGLIAPTQVEKNLYAFVSGLPKSSLIAGHPEDENLNNIPLYAKRAILINEELFGSLATRGIDRKLEERAVENLDAYYSDSWERVVSFCRKYGVTHLLVNEKYFSKMELFYRPISDRVERIIESRVNFVLSDLPDSVASFYDDGLSLINVPALESYYLGSKKG